jgi:beta-galactosidase GanA
MNQTHGGSFSTKSSYSSFSKNSDPMNKQPGGILKSNFIPKRVYNDHLTSASSTDPFQTLQQNNTSTTLTNISSSATSLDPKALLHDLFQELSRRGAFQLVYPFVLQQGGRDTHQYQSLFEEQRQADKVLHEQIHLARQRYSEVV